MAAVAVATVAATESTGDTHCAAGRRSPQARCGKANKYDASSDRQSLCRPLKVVPAVVRRDPVDRDRRRHYGQAAGRRPPSRRRRERRSAWRWQSKKEADDNQMPPSKGQARCGRRDGDGAGGLEQDGERPPTMTTLSRYPNGHFVALAKSSKVAGSQPAGGQGARGRRARLEEESARRRNRRRATRRSKRNASPEVKTDTPRKSGVFVAPRSDRALQDQRSGYGPGR